MSLYELSKLLCCCCSYNSLYWPCIKVALWTRERHAGQLHSWKGTQDKMKYFTIITLCLVILSTTANCWHRRINRYYTCTATGRVMCGNQPLKQVKVKLKDRDTILHPIFGEGRTNDDGRFEVSGRARDFTGTPDPFIEVFLEYSGSYGRMEVKRVDSLPATRCTRTRTRSYQRHIDFGDVVCTSSEHCRAYLLFYDELKEYNSRTGGMPLPYNCLYVKTHTWLHGGTAWAERHTVRIPRREVLNMETARHEFAHTIRHTLVRCN